ncbi:MAG: Serine active site containing protein 1 [Thelocarpon impressellum]|nr:MAG: Serine active site containing protein 1 [Thelocarpon impressellum]
MANVNIGPEVLSEGTAPIKADIVFVHGLMGDRLKTWTKDEVSWPRDLLPYDIDNARIITWGYNADVMTFFQRTSQSSIFQHALSLLQDIQRERQTDEEVARPLIFVGHSLGGLVIKQALCKAHEYKITRATHRHSRMGAIFDKAFGIVFVGAAPASSVEVLGGTKMVLELNNSPRNKKNSGMFTVWGNNSIDGSSVETYSPLAWAAIMDNAEGMQWLLQSGAEVDSQRNVNGLTALMAQATCNPIPGGQLITAAMLLQAGVSLDLRDPAGYTALHAALYMYNCELAAILIDAGAEVNAASARGITPLHACATMGSKQRESAQIILLLLDKGAETDATDIGGLTPYWIAKRGGNTYAADALKGRKGDSAVHDVMALRRSILRAFK